MPTIAWRLMETGGNANWSVREVVAPGASAPSITTTTLSDGNSGLPYEATITATGSTPITFSVTAGALPDWVTMTDGVIEGGPAYPGLYEFTITATNSEGSDSQALTLLVPNEMSGGAEITATSLDGSRLLTPVTATYTVTGGTVQLQFSPGATTYTLDPETGTFTVTGNPVAFELQERPTPQWQVVISVQSPNWTITDT